MIVFVGVKVRVIIQTRVSINSPAFCVLVVVCEAAMVSFLLGLQGCQRLLEGGNLLFGIALLLALHGDDGLGGVLHKALVGELFHDTLQETFQMGELCFLLRNLGVDVDHRT